MTIPFSAVVEVLIVSVTANAEIVNLDHRILDRNVRIKAVQLGGEGFTNADLRGVSRSLCILSGITAAELEEQYPQEFSSIKHSMVTLRGKFVEI